MIPPLEQWGASEEVAAPPASPEPPGWGQPPTPQPPTADYSPQANLPEPPAASEMVAGTATGSQPTQFALNCPHCSGEFHITEEMSGMQVACPHCQQALQLPEFGAIDSAPPAERPAGPLPSEASPRAASSLEPPTPEIPKQPDSPQKYRAPQGLSEQEAAFMRYPPGHGPKEDKASSEKQPSPKAPPDPSAMLPPQMPRGKGPVEKGGEKPASAAREDSNPLAAKKGTSKERTSSSRQSETKSAGSPTSDFAYPPGFKPKASQAAPQSNTSAPVAKASEPTTPAAPGQQGEGKKPDSQQGEPPQETAVARMPEKKVPEQKEQPEQEVRQAAEDAAVTSSEQASQQESSASNAIDAMLPPGAGATKPVQQPAKSTAPQAEKSPTQKPEMPESEGEIAAETSPAETTEPEHAISETEPASDSAKLDNLLPPGFSAPANKRQEGALHDDVSAGDSGGQQPASQEVDEPSHKGDKLSALLPPTVPKRDPAAATQSISAPADWQVKSHQQPRADGSVLIPTEDGGYARVFEPRRTVGYGEEEVELRKLTPEEKAARRFRRNLIIWTLGTIVLSLAGWLLANGGLF